MGAYSYQSSIVNFTRLRNAGHRLNITHVCSQITQFNILRVTIPKGLDSVTIENIKNYFRKAKIYMFAYLEGHVGGKELEEKVK